SSGSAWHESPGSLTGTRNVASRTCPSVAEALASSGRSRARRPRSASAAASAGGVGGRGPGAGGLRPKDGIRSRSATGGPPAEVVTAVGARAVECLGQEPGPVACDAPGVVPVPADLRGDRPRRAGWLPERGDNRREGPVELVGLGVDPR